MWKVYLSLLMSVVLIGLAIYTFTTGSYVRGSISLIIGVVGIYAAIVGYKHLKE